MLKFHKHSPEDSIPTSNIQTSAPDLPSSIDPAPTPILGGLLEPEQLAAKLGVSERTLARLHALRKGPARIRIGRKVFYDVESVRRWLRS